MKEAGGKTMKTTVFKVISFKRLSCPKSAKSLLADYCGSALKGSNHNVAVGGVQGEGGGGL